MVIFLNQRFPKRRERAIRTKLVRGAVAVKVRRLDVPGEGVAEGSIRAVPGVIENGGNHFRPGAGGPAVDAVRLCGLVAHRLRSDIGCRRECDLALGSSLVNQVTTSWFPPGEQILCRSGEKKGVRTQEQRELRPWHRLDALELLHLRGLPRRDHVPIDDD